MRVPTVCGFRRRRTRVTVGAAGIGSGGGVARKSTGGQGGGVARNSAGGQGGGVADFLTWEERRAQSAGGHGGGIARCGGLKPAGSEAVSTFELAKGNGGGCTGLRAKGGSGVTVSDASVSK